MVVMRSRVRFHVTLKMPIQIQPSLGWIMVALGTLEDNEGLGGTFRGSQEFGL